MNNSSTYRGDGWVGLLMLMVPSDIRHQFRGELMAERADMRTRGLPPWKVNALLAGSLFVGVAQHVPLSREAEHAALQPPGARRAALWGWAAWRGAGPLLFLAYALSNGWLWAAGVALLLTTFACLGIVALKAHEPFDVATVRLLNGAFGGLAATFVFGLLAGAFSSVLLLLALLFDSVGLGAFAVQSLVFMILFFLGVLSAVGWVPHEWEPQRLVRS
ncbi:MAG: hypothetical protein AAGD14_11385 [Planctomycetota bacterium]